jgi:dTDP-glucose pyrophosphorylase
LLLMTTAVIAAAGAGTRLGPLGQRYSKAMVPIAGRPLIEWGLRRLREAGVERIIVVAHTDDAALGEFLRSAHRDVAIALQDERRGIADAISRALPLIGDAAYLACACDSLFDADDIATIVARGQHRAAAAIVGVLAMEPGASASRSAVQLDGERVVAIVEKPRPGSVQSDLVAAPLYWLPRAVDSYLSANAARSERYVTSALSEYIADGGDVIGVRLRGRIEVTTAQDVAQAARSLEGGAPSPPGGGGGVRRKT